MTPRRRLLPLITATLTAGVTGMLAYRSLGAAGLPGCGVGSACDALLQSSYARVLGIPVSALALLLDAGVIALLLRRRPNPTLLNACAGALVGGAIYFTILQLLVVHQICPWCMASHTMGLVTALLLLGLPPTSPGEGKPMCSRLAMGAVGILAVGALAVVQQVAPGAASQRTIIRFADTGPGDQRALTVVVGDRGGRLEPHGLPVLGSPDAPILLISFFDYTCRFCRTMEHQLQAVRQAFGDRLAIVTVGVPLGTCNPNVEQTPPAHALSCALQELALAVWIVNPAGFEAIHPAFFDPDLTLPEARTRALQQVDEAKLNRALADPALKAQLARHSTLFGHLGGTLPQLIVGPTHVRGLPPSADSLIELIAQQTKLDPIKISP